MVDRKKEEHKHDKLSSGFIHLDCNENDVHLTKSKLPWSHSFTFDDKKKFLPLTDDFKIKGLISSSSKVNNPKMLAEIQRYKSTKSDYLDFSNLNLTEVTKEIFKDVSQVKALFLFNNRLTTLPESISNLVNLESLYLQDNLLSFEKPFTSLDNLTKIQIIDLRRNNIKGEFPVFLLKQKQLRQLLLCSNKITKIPPEVHSLSMLKIFTMSRNPLEPVVPSCLFPLLEMTLLDLSHTGISELPNSLCQCSALESLHLKNNSLTNLPDQIGLLKELKSLRLGNNKLRSLPKSLGDCQKLEVLDVENNKIQVLPEALFVNMTSLTNLLISYNEITELNLVGDKMLENVRNLNLNNNLLKVMPTAFFKAKNVLSVNLSDNEISQIPVQIIDWSQLRELDMCSNQLRQLPDEIGHLVELETLKLKFNQLESLPDKIGGLTALKVLDLESNSIEVLPDAIGNLQSLTELNLSINLLKTLPPTIGQIKSLVILKVTENKLNSLPTELGSLNNLRDLLVSENPDLANLPAELSLCSSLTVLNLESCSLSELPEPIVTGGSAMIIYFLQQVMQLRKQQSIQQTSPPPPNLE